jgi:hypothetical protein
MLILDIILVLWLVVVTHRQFIHNRRVKELEGLFWNHVRHNKDFDPNTGGHRCCGAKKPRKERVFGSAQGTIELAKDFDET